MNPAHPRVSGENHVGFTHTHPARGSSPRERGKQRPKLLDSPRPRLIPA